MADDENKEIVLSLRVPQRLIDDLNELKPLLEKLPEYQAVRTMTRSHLARIAIAHGIERLRDIVAQRTADNSQIDLLDSNHERIDPINDDKK